MPTSMVDDLGRVVWQAEIGVWGDLRDVHGVKAACPFRWPGQYEDEETGLYYNRFRYYAPEAGQYVSRDPIGLAGGLGIQRYVADPSRGTDPLGLSDSCGSLKLLPPGPKRPPEKAGEPIVGVELPRGYRFNQAVGPGQNTPGAFGTTDEIPSVSYVRNELAVIPGFKEDIAGVRTVEVIRPVRAQVSTVGPQVENGVLYEGGGSQIQILEYDPSNPYVKFVGPLRTIK